MAVLAAGKLGDPQRPVQVGKVGLRARATQGAAGGEQRGQPLSKLRMLGGVRFLQRQRGGLQFAQRRLAVVHFDDADGCWEAIGMLGDVGGRHVVHPHRVRDAFRLAVAPAR